MLDPACGDGRLLAAAAEAAPRRGAPPGAVELVGIELDGETAEQARLTVPRRGSWPATAGPWIPGGSFDAVIGNPPYLGQLARGHEPRRALPPGRRPYADVAAEFLLRAVELARPDGGRVALVLPQSVLATRDTEAIRATVRRQAAVTGLWWAGTQVFAAGVHVCVVVLERGRGAGPGGPLAGTGDGRPAGRPRRGRRRFDLGTARRRCRRGPAGRAWPTGHGRLGDLATATAGFRQHFYGLAPFVSDDGGGPRSSPPA